MTREEKRRRQRLRANTLFALFCAALLLTGYLLGRVTATATPTYPERVRALTLPEPMDKAGGLSVAYYSISNSERDLVERVVMAEAGGEGFDGQRLVAQCILNTSKSMGMRPDEVVLAPWQYAKPAETVSQEVKDAVSAVFDDGNMVTGEPIRWFYAPKYVYSAWHESKEFVLEHGGHRFFKEN